MRREVVQTLERFAVAMPEDRRRLSALGVHAQQPAAVIGNPQLAVTVDRDAVRPAVVLDDDVPLAGGRDAEDPAERNVGEEKISRSVERRPLEEAVNFMPGLVRVAPFAAALVAHGIGKAREDTRVDHLGWSEIEVPHRSDFMSNQPMSIELDSRLLDDRAPFRVLRLDEIRETPGTAAERLAAVGLEPGDEIGIGERLPALCVVPIDD